MTWPEFSFGLKFSPPKCELCNLSYENQFIKWHLNYCTFALRLGKFGEMMNLTLTARPPFNFLSVVNSHGWIQLAPFRFDENREMLVLC